MIFSSQVTRTIMGAYRRTGFGHAPSIGIRNTGSAVSQRAPRVSPVLRHHSQEESMNNRAITRERGVIPGCRQAGPDSHMPVDGLGRAWIEVSKLSCTIDTWLTAMREQ